MQYWHSGDCLRVRRELNEAIPDIAFAAEMVVFSHHPRVEVILVFVVELRIAVITMNFASLFFLGLGAMTKFIEGDQPCTPSVLFYPL
jgi:hypothetical protein